MGWLIGWDSKREVIAHLNKEEKDYKPLKSCVKGDTLWQVIETHRGLFIGCNLIGGSKKEGFGYKDMEEAAHPFRYHCPLGYLEMVTEVTCGEWRDKVRKHHAENALKSSKFLFTLSGVPKVLQYAKRYSLEVVQAHLEKTYLATHFTLEIVK